MNNVIYSKYIGSKPGASYVNVTAENNGFAVFFIDGLNDETSLVKWFNYDRTAAIEFGVEYAKKKLEDKIGEHTVLF